MKEDYKVEVTEALARLKYRFYMVRRRKRMAAPVSVALAKEIVMQLVPSDFVKHERNRNNLLQYVWVFKTDYGRTYYINLFLLRIITK